jgi:hypothetical protein
MIIHGTLATARSASVAVTLAQRSATRTWTTVAPGRVPLIEQTINRAAWTGTQMLLPGQTNSAY